MLTDAEIGTAPHARTLFFPMLARVRDAAAVGVEPCTAGNGPRQVMQHYPLPLSRGELYRSYCRGHTEQNGASVVKVRNIL
jgi:hypothetical protein